MNEISGFKKHGIKHSSASQINMYSNSPDAWVARYLFNKRFAGSIAMTVGVEAENAVVNVIAGGYSVDDAKKQAHKMVRKSSGLGLTLTSAETKRIEGMDGMIDNALEYLKQFGEPEFDGDIVDGIKQKKIELVCNAGNWSLPIIGYLDFEYPKLGKVIDLKTTMATPSNMSVEHMRQGSIYKGAKSNYSVEFLYVTPKKYVCHTIENHAPVLEEIKNILIRQERLLSRMSKEEIRDIIPLTNTYYWSGSQDIKTELFG